MREYKGGGGGEGRRRWQNIPGSLHVPSPYKKTFVISRLSLSWMICCAAHQSKSVGKNFSLRQAGGLSRAVLG